MKEKLRKFYKRYRKWKAWDTKPERVEVCEGIAIHESMYDIHENRLWTLILKGFIVYLLTMGGMGCYLTAMGCNHSRYRRTLLSSLLQLQGRESGISHILPVFLDIHLSVQELY